jgi:hypothetical protein
MSDTQRTPQTFEEWCACLCAIAAKDQNRYGPNPIESCGEDCWRDYYDDGYSPEDAWWEDGTYV